MTEIYIFVPDDENDIPLLLRIFQSLFYRNRDKVVIYSNRDSKYHDVARRIANWIECSFHHNFNLNSREINNFCNKYLYHDNRINVFVVSIDIAKLTVKSIDPDCIFDLPQVGTIVRLKDIVIKNKPVRK